MADIIHQLQDQADIRDVIARFGDCAIFNDKAGFRDVWTADAVWTIAAPADLRAQGREEISAMLTRLRDEREFFVHFAASGPIVITGDEAQVRCVCHEAARGPAGAFYRNHAIYHDRLQRTAGGWRFRQRHYAYVWLDFSPFEGAAYPLWQA